MMQRVRNAFKMQSFTYDKIGESIAKDKDGKDIPGIVEADETYIGGKPGNMHKHKQEQIKEIGAQRKICRCWCGSKRRRSTVKGN